VSDYTIEPLGSDTWDAFGRLMEHHNGVFGGCWCTWLHTLHGERTSTAEGNRAFKQRLVAEGRAHAALVMAGGEAVAWCPYGRGALDLIAQAGGGVVEAYPHDNEGRRASVLYNGTRTLFGEAGFSHVRAKGQRNCVMRLEVP